MRAVLAMLVMVLVFAATAHAFSASIQPPRMVLRGNVSDVLTVYVDAKNPNAVPVTVNVTLVGLDNVKIVDDVKFFELAPNETRRVVMEVTITKPGTSGGEVQFAFDPKEKIEDLERGLALATQILTIAPGDGTTTTTLPEGTTTTVPVGLPNADFVNIVLAVGAVITAVLLFMFFRR